MKILFPVPPRLGQPAGVGADYSQLVPPLDDLEDPPFQVGRVAGVEKPARSPLSIEGEQVRG